MSIISLYIIASNEIFMQNDPSFRNGWEPMTKNNPHTRWCCCTYETMQWCPVNVVFIQNVPSFKNIENHCQLRIIPTHDDVVVLMKRCNAAQKCKHFLLRSNSLFLLCISFTPRSRSGRNPIKEIKPWKRLK